ncbi:hypothetical protein [Acidovorax sp. PRC11]|uniref:hypothetical protein n=1 Tax=Acidovorax sp. PRC11 TaxID=2962592 RepID=UPI0028812C73|nr:hypothetical protein [Acidovorax sp. PRC11]MDT0137222.1 hypothetical protein [Acidovorax sp. PRC11]
MQKRLTPLPPTLRKIAKDFKCDYIPLSLIESKNQARDNLYSISIEDEYRLNIEYADFENFLETIKKIAAEKIKENSTIYFWLDSLANELRLSIISSNDLTKSFKTKINNVSLKKIIIEYLNNNIESGLDKEEGLWVSSCSISPK